MKVGKEAVLTERALYARNHASPILKTRKPRSQNMDTLVKVT